MSALPVFDSRDARCKTPFGAVPCGRNVSLTLRPVQAQGFVRGELLLYDEFSDRHLVYPLSRLDAQEDRDVFFVTFAAPAEGTLCWYHFRFYQSDGAAFLLDRTGWRDQGEPVCWQLTVYDGADHTPGWFGQGVTYQIFPDRFCRLSQPDPTGLPGHRVVHSDWNDAPDWRPDAFGEVRNRDFFGGSLAGITAKLDYLAALSVSTLYLCPIFCSASNHRYDTADYLRIDPMLGTEEDFCTLCREAEQRGIRVILDGVFNHTGSDSVYFNAAGSFPSLGAAQSLDSPYADWYHFSHWPDQYDSWWGIHTLPAVNEASPSYGAFIIDDQDAVIRRWLRLGAWGWRLDVADELPDEFIARIRAAVSETKPEAVLLGEVWEDGSNKIAYSKRRRYLLGGETHGLMNYPFRNAALAYLQGGDAAAFREVMETLRENYPAPAFYSAMNFLGTHDTGRILTVLGAAQVPASKEERSVYQLSEPEYHRGMARLLLAELLLYTFPGSPTVFYGDEIGMQGFEDPFNRGTYPWGRENRALLDYFIRLGHLRATRPSLRRGDITYLLAQGPGLVFARRAGNEVSLTVLNAGDEALDLTLPWSGDTAEDALTGQRFLSGGGHVRLTVPPCEGLLLI